MAKGTEQGAPSRTAMIAAIEPTSTGWGRTAFLVGYGGVVGVLGLLMMLCAGIIVLDGFMTDPVVATVAAITALSFALPFLVVLLWLDRNEPEPPQLVAIAFLWGAVMATGLSILFNDTFAAVSGLVVRNEAVTAQLTASFSAPFVEELTKALALVTLYLFFRRDFDNVLDGVFYGAVVGLGFATFENFLYYARTGSVGGVVYLTIVRGVLISVGSHACYTAITGASVGMFRVLRTGTARWFLPPLGLGLAMFVHFVWNTFTNLFTWPEQDAFSFLVVSIPLSVTLLQLPFVTMVAVVAFVSLRHERAMIGIYLASERAPVLLDGELDRLVPVRRRSLHLAKLLLTLRLGEWWVTRQRNRRLVRLAFEKWHMDREAELGDEAEGRGHALAVLALRQELAGLRLPG